MGMFYIKMTRPEIKPGTYLLSRCSRSARTAFKLLIILLIQLEGCANFVIHLCHSQVCCKNDLF